MMKPITLVIADDHPVFREGLMKILEKDTDISLLGAASDGNEAFAMIKQYEPNIVVLDFSMPGMNGLEIAKSSLEMYPDMGFIILTMFNDEEYIQEALSLGVKGYLLKDSVVRDILDSIYSVAAGDIFITPLVQSVLNDSDKKENKDSVLMSLDTLTPSELQVLKRVADNKTSQQIAAELFVSIRTVQNHRMNMANKLNLTGHHKLLEFALRYKKMITQTK